MTAKERIEKIIGITKTKEISDFTSAAIIGHGITHYSHNQLPILSIPVDLCDAVFRATSGHTNIFGKRFALEASKLYHEIKSHSNKSTEDMRGQIVITGEDIFQVIDCMITPDFVEDVSHGDSLDERNVFAAVKQTENCVVVVLSVGGKRNPNVTPQQIIFFKKEKWDLLKDQNISIREIVYGDKKKRPLDPTFADMIKKNRVTVAHHES